MSHVRARTGRRALASVAAFLALAVLAGCGASALAKAPEAGDYAPAPVVAASPPPPPEAPPVAPSPAEAPLMGERTRGGGGVEPAAELPHSAAMLAYTGHLSMAVYHVTDSIAEVRRLAERSGGYLSVRSDTSITVRVPRERFAGTLALIERVGDVLHRDIKAEDVTDVFVDTDARLRNARAMRDRLASLLLRAPVKEAIEIERELGRVTEEIERLEGRMKVLRDQVAFSTITVTFEPVREQTVHDTSLLAPFPWLSDLGLQPLLDVHQ